MTQENKVAELMKPRRRVQIPYPEMGRHGIEVGDILTDDGKDCVRDQNGKARPAFEWETFTEIFKKLEWWEDIEISHLPMFIRFGGFNERHAIYKIVSWDTLNENLVKEFSPCGYAEYPHEYFISLRFQGSQPATQSEYDQYIKQNL